MNDGVVALARTLDQELVALARGVSLACPVCSEFVMHVRGAHGLAIACPECKSILAEGHEVPQLALPSIAQSAAERSGGRGEASASPQGSRPARLGVTAARSRATLTDAGRVTAGVRFGGALEESPDTTGQDAGEIPDGESRWTVAQKGDRRGFGSGKGETVG